MRHEHVVVVRFESVGLTSLMRLQTVGQAMNAHLHKREQNGRRRFIVEHLLLSIDRQNADHFVHQSSGCFPIVPELTQLLEETIVSAVRHRSRTTM
jgi:hypothetical protein